MPFSDTLKRTKKLRIHYKILPHNAQRVYLIFLINIVRDEAIKYLTQNGLRMQM